MSKQWTPKTTNAAHPDNSLNIPARETWFATRQRQMRRTRYLAAVQSGQIKQQPEHPQAKGLFGG